MRAELIGCGCVLMALAWFVILIFVTANFLGEVA